MNSDNKKLGTDTSSSSVSKSISNDSELKSDSSTALPSKSGLVVDPSEKSTSCSRSGKEWYHLDSEEYLYLLAPAVVGFSSSFVCKIGNKAAENVPARPPSYVFIIVWTLIYLMMGVVWVWVRRIASTLDCKIHRHCAKLKIDIMMSAIIILQLLWVYFYGCSGNKKYALYALAFNILAALIALEYIYRADEYAAYLFTPYLVWLLYAFNLNMTEVNVSTTLVVDTFGSKNNVSAPLMTDTLTSKNNMSTENVLKA